MEKVSWNSGVWSHPPIDSYESKEGHLIVEAKEGSDAWRITSYGFIHANEHALLKPMSQDTSVEVSFLCQLKEQFDQAGVFLHVDESVWIKAGVEMSDGLPQLGAVVTHGYSDWSVAPIPEWLDQRVTIRLSRSGDAVTIRACVDQGPFRLVRVAQLDPKAICHVGPYICAPSRSGLRLTFLDWKEGPSDISLHHD